MQALCELPDQAQSAFLLNFIELLERKRSKLGKLPAYVRMTEFRSPTLLFHGNQMEWLFSYKAFYSGEGEISLIFELEDDWSLNFGNSKFSKKCFKSTVRHNCSCSNTNLQCIHYHLAIEELCQQLSRKTVPSAIQWMRRCFRDSTELGNDLLEQLEANLSSGNADKDAEAEHRIQWRIAIDQDDYSSTEDFLVRCYLQKKKVRGGWTVGRLIRDLQESLPDNAYRSEQDYLIASLVDAYEAYDHNAGLILLQIFKSLKDQPNVVWDREGLPAVEIVAAQPTMSVVDENGKYSVDINVAGHSINPSSEFLEISRDAVLGWVVDESMNRLYYFQSSKSTLDRMHQFSESRKRGVRFTPEAAIKVTTLLSDPKYKHILRTELPESLAGPEIALPADIQLHLIPRQPEGLEAHLRVACDAVAELPIPGVEPARLPVTTPAGPVQYVRDLAAESQRADVLVDALGLGSYAYDGPYTWIAESIPAALALIEKAQQQAEQGLTVCWPKSQPMRLLGEITPQSLRVRVTTQRDWFGIEGELVIDGLEIPLAELLAALRRGGRYVQLGSGEFAVINEQLRKRLTLMDDVTNTEGKQMRIGRASAPLLKDSIGEDIPFESDAKWRTAIERLTNTKGLPTKPPKGLKAELRDYQVAGYRWLAKLSHWGLGGCLADDMGLGKTVQALGVLLDRASMGPTLVIAPTSVGVNWVRESKRFAPSLTPKLYREHNRDDLIRDAAAGDLVITSYQLLQRDAERFSSRTWSTLVLDESQYIKNFQTKTSQAIRNLEADWCLAISGTPLENHLGELWSLMRVISPGLLGSWERFRKRFAEQIERDQDKERLEALSHVVRPFILRRTKSDVLTELPSRTEVVLSVELSPAERKKYDAARLAALADLTAPKEGDNEQKKRIRVLTWLTRLRQLACHVRLVDDKWKKSSAKLDQFMEIVEELRQNNHRALVFSQFVQHLSLLRAALDKANISYQYLDGSTPAAKRQAAIDAFQNGEDSLFLISLKAGGTGLNLTAADYVLHLDPWWNPAVEDQATDRAHRIGQTRKVTVYRFVTRDTIEEQIISLHESKRKLMSGLLEGTDSAGKMSTSELVDLIRTNQLSES